MRSYLLVFNGKQTTRRHVISCIDTIAEIINWLAFFDNALCVVSDLDAKALSERIRFVLPNIQFVVTELEPGKKKGWLPKSVWTFMNNPLPVQNEAAE